MNGIINTLLFKYCQFDDLQVQNALEPYRCTGRLATALNVPTDDFDASLRAVEDAIQKLRVARDKISFTIRAVDVDSLLPPAAHDARAAADVVDEEEAGASTSSTSCTASGLERSTSSELGT